MVKLRFVAPEKVPKSEGRARNRLKKKKTKAFPLHRLPNEVLCVILSQLPFKEAARTSIVCRKWRRLWRCYPKLILTRETMSGGSAAGDHPTLDMATFIRRVNSIVRQLSSSATLNKFVVKFPLLSKDASHHIDRWVSLSAASRARRIILDLCPEVASTDRNGRYSFPVHLFSGSSCVKYSFPLHLFSGSSCVKSLCLGFVSMNLPPGRPCGFTNLKKLGLHMVSITGDLQCLLPECDVLEWLSLTDCSLHPYLILHRPLQRLRYLRVLNCRLHRLELQAPNLTKFAFTNYPVPFTLGDCPDMSMASIGLLSPEYSFGYACTELPASLPHVQDSLSISLNIRTEEAQESVKGSISVFAKLRHLALTVSIEGCPRTGTGILHLASLLQLAPVLEELEIHMCCREAPLYTRDLDEATSPRSLYKHLRVVHMTGFYAIRGQLELARHILQSSAALKRMIIDPKVILGTPITFATEKVMTAYAGPSSNVRVERASCVCFGEGGALAELIPSFEKSVDNASRDEDDSQPMKTNDNDNNLRGIEGVMAMPELVVQALALSVRYLKVFGMERIICFGSSFRPFSADTEMSLSANTLQQLEVLRNNSDGTTEGSLFQTTNNTRTAFGSRLFRNWLTHPLCDRHRICARHDAVSEISESMGSRHSINNLQDGGDVFCAALARSDLSTILSSVLEMLGKSLDIQRGITRIFHCKATSKEFVGVIQSILTAGKQMQKLVLDDIDIVSSQHKPVHSSLLRRLISTASSSTVLNTAVKLLSCLNKEAADQGDMLNLFISSVDHFPEVAEGRVNVNMAQHKLELLIVEYRKQLGMRNLEFKTVAGTTHLIELPVDRRVPSNWVKINSTKKTIRYHTPEILKNLDNLLLAKEELAIICRSTWHKFLTDFSKYYAQFQAVVESLASLDCLYSLAVLAKQNNYVRPIFVQESEPSQIHIKDGRHPVLESLLGDNFVPNDTELHAGGEYCQIVTGPNMGGKSCYIRQVALITMMAQVGSFVPASSAMLHVVDGIYTRMGASDSIQQGTSTFHEEMNEASNILHNCSSRSLVIIDELGRGTSTHDGVAIAYATLHYLLKEKKCIVIFVTHYPKILDIQREFEGSVGAYHVSYLATRKLMEVTDKTLEASPESKDLGEITFLYKLVAGASDRSFGLNVALLAQLPSRCIKRASIMAAKLQEELSVREENKLQRTMDAATVGGPSESCTKVGLVCAQPYQALAEACRRVLLAMTLAQSNNDATDTLPLKNAREVARNTIGSFHI